MAATHYCSYCRFYGTDTFGTLGEIEAHATTHPVTGEALPIADWLEYLRGELQAERISYGELAELRTLTPYIDAGDVQLLEAAGVPEGETSQD